MTQQDKKQFGTIAFDGADDYVVIDEESAKKMLESLRDLGPGSVAVPSRDTRHLHPNLMNGLLIPRQNGVLYDESGNGNHGRIINFDGTDDFVDSQKREDPK